VFEPLTEAPEGVYEHRAFLVCDGEVVVHRVDGAAARSLDLAEATELLGEQPALVLGRLGSTVYWASEFGEDIAVGPTHRMDGLRALHGHLDDSEWNIAGRAVQLLDWQQDNRFCGRCGHPTERAPGERALRCPDDGVLAYPRLSPAVIMLIERDDGRALLGRSGRWDTPMYSTLAGFVEPGETLEEAVQREVREEVGLEVGQVEYFGSQPWPFPNSLMVGFNARWLGGDIQVDGEEIVDAQWFTPDKLPEIPPKLSIARSLIDTWSSRNL